MTKDWSPDDPLLRSPHGPHEVAAILRMRKGGWPGEKIAKALGIGASKVLVQWSRAATEVDNAIQANRPIHDPILTEGIE